MTDDFTPELIDDREFSKRLELYPTDWTSRTVRPATVLAALMHQAPAEALQESLEEAAPLIAAIGYAAECMNDEDIYILNCIQSEGITYDELANRLGLSRSRAWRLHERALNRLRTLLLNHQPVRERLGMEPTWNAAAMDALTSIAGFDDTFEADELADYPYPLEVAISDIDLWVESAVFEMRQGREYAAMTALVQAASCAVSYLRTLDKWRLIDMHKLLCAKQHDYGHGNILKFGMQGVMVRVSDKVERLKNLRNSGSSPRNESVLDSFYDLVGYAVIAKMLKAETFELPFDPSVLAS